MQSDYPRQTTPVVIWLISALVAAFVLELILLSPWLGGIGPTLVNNLVLTTGNLHGGKIWTLFTHSLVHSTGNPLHLLFVLLGLFFVGRELEPILGARRFLGLYTGSILTGGLLWGLVNWVHGGVHLGAGAALIGFLVVLAGVQPALQLSMFFIPVSFGIRHVIYVLLGMNALGLLFYEVQGSPVPLGLTPSAQLGGMLAGWLYFRFVYTNRGLDRAPGFTLPSWLRRMKPAPKAAPKPAFIPSRKAPPSLRAEVDRILDKISHSGMASLTEEERGILDEVSRRRRTN